MSTALLCVNKLCCYALKNKMVTRTEKIHLSDQCCSGGNNDRQELTWIA